MQQSYDEKKDNNHYDCDDYYLFIVLKSKPYIVSVLETLYIKGAGFVCRVLIRDPCIEIGRI